jgi:hypothetical protein
VRSRKTDFDSSPQELKSERTRGNSSLGAAFVHSFPFRCSQPANRRQSGLGCPSCVSYRSSMDGRSLVLSRRCLAPGGGTIPSVREHSRTRLACRRSSFGAPRESRLCRRSQSPVSAPSDDRRVLLMKMNSSPSAPYRSTDVFANSIDSNSRIRALRTLIYLSR